MAGDAELVLDLSEESLIAAARERTGLTEFGDEGFREGLRVLLETYQRAGLRPGGRKVTRRRLIQLLCNRLRVEQAFRRHPEILEREIRSPVYLTGLPRTGTSALFNLLAIDPAARPLLLWEAMNPDPYEGGSVGPGGEGPRCEDQSPGAGGEGPRYEGESVGPGGEDPRLVATRAHFERERQKDPGFDKIHYRRADGPEECVLLTAHTFCDAQNGVEPLMSPFREWFQAQDLRPAYAYYRDLLKLLDWQRPGERWLLKSPAHLWALDILVEMFPDVCIIQTHRNPLQIIPSYCSMMAAIMSIRESVDPLELGPTVLEYLARSLERGIAARDGIDPNRFLDVDYHRFVEHPMQTVEQIHEHFGLGLRSGTADAMRAHLRENPQHQHGSHHYSLEEYGLSAEAVRERLAGYIERFGLST
jgi:hypothetical protein